MSDPYTFPRSTRHMGTSTPLSARTPVGTSVIISASCIAYVTSQCGRGILVLDHEYHVGDHLLVADTVNRICDAVVMDSNGSGESEQIYIHYVGFSTRWDEWISVHSSRIHHDSERGITRARVMQYQGEGVGLTTLTNLVGRVGIITQVSHIPSTHDNPSSDTMVSIMVQDPDIGTYIHFWTRASLLQIYPSSIQRHISLPAIYACSLSTLMIHAIDMEQMMIRRTVLICDHILLRYVCVMS